jgi:hypothetical protein
METEHAADTLQRRFIGGRRRKGRQGFGGLRYWRSREFGGEFADQYLHFMIFDGDSAKRIAGTDSARFA